MKQEHEPYSATSAPATMALKKTIVEQKKARNAREQTPTAREQEMGEAMIPKNTCTQSSSNWDGWLEEKLNSIGEKEPWRKP